MKVYTVALEDQGIDRAPSGLGQCERTMRRNPVPRFDRRGDRYRPAWTQRCPNPATRLVDGTALRAIHAPRINGDDPR